MGADEEIEGLALQLRETGEGDRGRLFGLVSGHVRPLLSSMVPASDLDDAVQDALIDTMTKFDQWDPERGAFLTWARLLVRYRTLDRLRRRRPDVRGKDGFLEQSDDAAARDLSRVDDADLVQALFAHLIDSHDTKGERVLAACRDLAFAGQPTTADAIATRAELDESTTRRALIRVRVALRALQSRA